MTTSETLNIQIALRGLEATTRGITGIGDRMRSVVAAVSAVGAAVAGSAIVREFAAINGEIAKTATEAEKFGVSTEFLSSFQYALKLSGVEQGKAAEAMKGFVEKAQSQGRAIGDLSAELMRQAEVFSRMPDGPQKTAMAMNLFGEAGIALIPVLNKGESGLQDIAEEARRFGMVVDTEAAKAAKGLKIDMERLNAVLEGTKRKMAQDVTPAFSELAKVGAALATLSNPAGGGSWLKQAAEDVSSSVSGFTRGYLEIKGFLDTYVPALIVTGSHQRALNDGLEASDKLLKEYDASLRKLKEPMADVAKQAAVIFGAMNAADRERALAMATLSNAEASARGSMVSDVKRREEARKIAQQRLDEIRGQIQDLEREAGGFLYEYGTDPHGGGGQAATERSLAARERRVALIREETAAQAELNQLGSSEARMVWTNTFLDLQNQWGSLSAQLAATFAGTFNAGISSISSNLTGVIMRTQSWGQALANIGTTILSTVVNAIIGMGIQWIATQILMATVGKAIQAASTKALIPIAKAQAAIWAIPANLATIASYGGAAAASPGFITAAQAVVSASAVAGFQAGGYTGNVGTSTPAGIVHGREFVMSAPATASIGVDALEFMNATGAVPSGSSREQRIVIVDDARTAADLEQDPEFETVVVNLMGKNAWRVR